MTEFHEIARGLHFPEGPVVLPDGSVVVSEVALGRVSRVREGSVDPIAETGGSPAGGARGPDGALYLCNSGGTAFRERNGCIEPHGPSVDYEFGRIERVDLETGETKVLYRDCAGRPLSSPNDIVFDSAGGFYFTDLGKTHARHRDRGSVYYAKSDGSFIQEVVYPLETPNGIGLSPDGQHLYVAETIPGRLWSFDLVEPGSVRTRDDRFARGELVAGLPGLQCFDSLAVQLDGAICVATLVNGGITRISADGSRVEHFSFPDAFTTNLCFGGPDNQTAFVTLSSSGRLVACPWDTPGLPLNYA